MAHASSALPADYRIRPLQLTNFDRLSLYLMPRNLQRLPNWLSITVLLTLCRIAHGLYFAIIPSIGLYVGTIVIMSTVPVGWAWIWISWLALLGICIAIGLTHREDWLQYCWVVEHQGRFIAYGTLHPRPGYSIIEALQVHPKWARRGIGSALVKTMIEDAPKPIYVDSAIQVTRFYTRLGFRKIRFNDLVPEAQKQLMLRGIATLLVYD